MRQKDLTQGTIWKQLLMFALPLLGSSFVQQLYNTVDLLFAGTLGKEASAAVGSSSLVITCIIGFFTGLSVGVSVIVSHAFGAKDGDKISRAVHSGILISIIGGGILSAAGIALARVFLTWMNTPEVIMDQSVRYVRYYLLCMIPLVMYNMNSGIIRATGDSRTPLMIQLFGGIANVLLDAAVIFLLNGGIAGIALASTFSQGVAAILSLRVLINADGYCKVRQDRLRIDPNIFKETLLIGAPAGFQSLVITLSNVFVQYKVNSFGVTAMAAFASYFKVELINYLPIVAFGQAMMTFAGQNHGAGKTDRVRAGVKACIIMGCIYVICSASLLLVFGRQAFWLFNRDPDVIATGLRIIHVTFPFYWIYVILETLADAIRGMGKSIPPMIIILFNICVLRTVLLFVLTSYKAVIESVAATYPLAWLATAVCLTIYWLRMFFRSKSSDK